MKKMTLLFLSISFILGLTACGSQTADTGNTPGTGNTSDIGSSSDTSYQSVNTADTLFAPTDTYTIDAAVDPNKPTNGMLPKNPMKVASLVYMTTDISPDGLMAVYEALDMELSGDNIAVKLSTGEPPAGNYLDPDLIKDLVQHVNGTIVEDDTDNVLEAFDGCLVLTHFRGDETVGFVGAVKNISMGVSSVESMADAGKSVADHLDGNILYINVMDRLSIDCDCNGNLAEPDIHDIGILASRDPVALDQACVDLIYKAEGNEAFVNRMESLNAQHVLEAGTEIGLGMRSYAIVNVDNGANDVQLLN